MCVGEHISRHNGGEGQSVRACLIWAVGLAGLWLDDCLGEAQLKLSQASLSHFLSLFFPLSPSLSSFFPRVTGWDIKTGILINCATLPPAALNMLRPRQAVCYISDSLVLFQLDLAYLLLSHLLLPLFSLLCLLSNFQISLTGGISLTPATHFYPLCIPPQFDPNKWRLQPIDKVIPWGLYDRINQFLLRTRRELIFTCVLFHWPWNYPLCPP